MLFVLINAHEPLNASLGLALRILAVVALGAVIVLAVVANARFREPRDERSDATNPRRFWLIVTVEVVLLAAGIAVLRTLGAPEEANVAWIALVVGVHLVAFLTVWQEPSIVMPGVILAVLGVVGLAMVATSAVEWTPFVSGVLSGVTLLGFSLAYAARELHRTTVPV
jgi:hypothetical protein